MAEVRLTRRALRLSLADALFFSLMVGVGETYLIADMVRLGAPPLEQALVLTFPLFIGALGPVISLAVMPGVRHRKRVVVTGVVGQVAALVAIVAADLGGRLSPWGLIGLVSLYQVTGQAAGTAWASWYGDVVPRAIRGRYFARRNRIVHLGTLVGLLGGGATLHYLEPGAAGTVPAGEGGLGYAAIFGAAAVFRALSAVFLAAAHEPPLEKPRLLHDAAEFVRSAAALPARRLILVAAALHLTVYMASPYFGPFMLEDLALPYLEYTIASISVVLIKFAVLPAWGRSIDRHGARGLYLLAIVLVALVPLPWLFARGMAVVVAAQLISGFSWGGHEVAQFSLLLDSAPARIRLHVLAAMNILVGLAQLSGSLIGGTLLAAFGGAYAVIFAISTAARLVVALFAPLLIPAGTGAPGPGRRRLLLRVLGFRASGGVEHRPLPVDETDGN